MLVGRRPGPELLAVVAHHADPVAGLGGVVAEVADDVLDVPERDPVAQALLGPEDRQQPALVLGRVGAPQVRLGDRGRPEVLVVEDRPAVARADQRRRQVRLPDALGQPRPERTPAGDPLDHLGHPRELVDPVLLGQRGEHGLVQAAAEDLDLAAVDQRAQPLEEGGSLGRQPLEQRARVVQREPDARVALEGRDHRQVGLLVHLGEHPAEVADRLVVVDGEGERDAGCHRALPSRCRQRATAATPSVACTSASAAAAGRYRRSTYSWSMRVVEKRQIVLAIELRISCIQRCGTPSAPRS